MFPLDRVVLALAAADTLDADAYASNTKGLIFLGVFVLGSIAAIIWWLQR